MDEAATKLPVAKRHCHGLRAILFVVAATTSANARADVYRCMVKGAPVYTDKPCEPGAQPHALPALGAVPPAERVKIPSGHDSRNAARAARDKSDAAWLKQHEARKAQDARMNAAISEGRVLRDMTPDQVRRALGSPDDVERQSGSEEWVYGTGRNRQTVFIENGRVTRISGRKP